MLKGGKLGKENQRDLTTPESNVIEKGLSAMSSSGCSGESPGSPVVHRLHTPVLPLLGCGVTLQTSCNPQAAPPKEGCRARSCAQFWVLLSTENKIQEVDQKMRHSVGMQCWWYFRSDLELRISWGRKIEERLSVVWMGLLNQHLLWHLKVKNNKNRTYTLCCLVKKSTLTQKNILIVKVHLCLCELDDLVFLCLPLNSVIIAVQYIPGSVVLVEFLVGGDLKFCSRHTLVSNATDSKENRFIQNTFSTGWNSFILIVLLFSFSQKKTNNKPLHIILQKMLQLSSTNPTLVLSPRVCMPRERGDRTLKS